MVILAYSAHRGTHDALDSGARSRHPEEGEMLDGHPTLKAYLDKVRKDNLRFLVSAVAWNIMVSAIPVTIGMIALSKVAFGGSTRHREIEQQLSRAFQGVLQPHYLDRVVGTTVHHSMLLVLLSVLAALWGAWNIGFALSQSFN